MDRQQNIDNINNAILKSHNSVILTGPKLTGKTQEVIKITKQGNFDKVFVLSYLKEFDEIDNVEYLFIFDDFKGVKFADFASSLYAALNKMKQEIENSLSNYMLIIDDAVFIYELNISRFTKVSKDLNYNDLLVDIIASNNLQVVHAMQDKKDRYIETTKA